MPFRHPDFNAKTALADSTTWRRSMEMRHAVVPKLILCHHGNSAACAPGCHVQMP